MTNNALPLGWANCTLDQVIASNGLFVDGDWVESKDQDPSGSVRLIQLADIGDGSFRDKSARFLTESKALELRCTFLKQGDLLVARMPDPLGRCCIFPLEGDTKFVTVVDVCVIRLGSPSVDSKYMLYLINSPSVRADIASLQSGSTRKRISRRNLSTVFVRLAPLNEQRRIVAKIEELFSELDKGIESLQTAREQLKVYRQAVLKHAFEGKLTAKWRAENQDKLETAEELVGRLQAERKVRYEEQVNEWEANGRVGRKPAKPLLPKLESLPLDAQNNLPEAWATLELSNLAEECVLGKMLDKTKNLGTPRPYLGNINVRWGSFDVDELKRMKIEDHEIERYRVQTGDLVICEGGEPGRCAIWRDSEHAVFIQKALHRVRFTRSYDPYFAYYYLIYASLTQRLSDYFTGTTIKHLTGTGLGKISFPVCSIDEQRQIVNLLERDLSAIDRLDAQISHEFIKSEALRQSILKKAFAGQLVPQDPKDEPASVLLERIRAERENGSGPRKSKGRQPMVPV